MTPRRPPRGPIRVASAAFGAFGLVAFGLAGCASAPPMLTLEERAICKDFSLDCSSGFPGLSEEDRMMWASGALHQAQCTMDADGEVSCE